MDPESKVLDIVSYAWAGLGAAFGPVLIVSLYSSSVSRLAAIAGIVVGGLTVVIWKPLSGGWFDLYELLPGFIFSFMSIFIVRCFEREKSQALIRLHRTFEKELY